MYSDQASRLQQQQRNLLSDRLSALTNVIAFESYRKFIQIQLHNIAKLEPRGGKTQNFPGSNILYAKTFRT